MPFKSVILGYICSDIILQDNICQIQDTHLVILVDQVSNSVYCKNGLHLLKCTTNFYIGQFNPTSGAVACTQALTGQYVDVYNAISGTFCPNGKPEYSEASLNNTNNTNNIYNMMIIGYI